MARNSWLDGFRRREEAPCPRCMEKDGLLFLGGERRAKLEERIRLLEAEHEDIHLCSPASTLRRAQASLQEARRCRHAFVTDLPAPLSKLADLVLAYRPASLPSVTELMAAEEALEARQTAIREFVTENVPPLGSSPKDPKPRPEDLSHLLTARDECRALVVSLTAELHTAIQEADLEAQLVHCREETLPTVEGLLALFSPPLGSSSEALEVALDRVPAFHRDSSTRLQVLSLTAEANVKSVQTALQAAAQSLSPDGPALRPEVNLNELWHQTEVSAHEEICFVRRHEERCWGLEGIVLEAGHELRRRLEGFIADSDRLLDVAAYYKAKAEALTQPRPDATALQAALDRLREAKRESIKKNAEFEVNQLGESPRRVTASREELLAIRLAAQQQQIEVENELFRLAVAAANASPELPLLYEAYRFHDLLGRDSMDGLWKKGRRLEDYDEEKRLTGGRHMVVIATFAGEKCALKEYSVGVAGLQALRNELLVLSRLHHPNIVEVQAVVVDMRQYRAYVQMPFYAGGTMSGWIRTRPPGEHVRCAAAGVLQGLVHMHAHHVIHCDVKMDNVLVVLQEGADPATDPVRAILSDFDVSLDCQQRTATLTQPGKPGFTLLYAAPEVLEGGLASYASDMWSFGCLLALAAFPTAEIEFVDDGESLCYVPPPEAPQGKGTLGELLVRLFAPHPLDRPAAGEALLHPFFTAATAALRQRAAHQAQLEALLAEGKAVAAQATSLETLQAEYIARARRVTNNLRSLGQLWQGLVDRRAALDFCDLPGQHAIGEQQRHLESSHADICVDLAALATQAEGLCQQHRALLRAIADREERLQEVRRQLAGPMPGPPMYWNSIGGRCGRRLVDVTATPLRRRAAEWLGVSPKQVDRVERVEDDVRWAAYAARRALAGRAPPLPSPLDQDEWVQELELDRDVNEQLLWHSTPSAFLGARLRGVTPGPYGCGLYFSDSVALAAPPPPPGGPAGPRCLVLARVALGRPYVVTGPCSATRQPPRTSLVAGGPSVGLRYDCVRGPSPSADTPGHLVVVFDPDCAFPELVVTFSPGDVPPSPAAPSETSSATSVGSGSCAEMPLSSLAGRPASVELKEDL